MSDVDLMFLDEDDDAADLSAIDVVRRGIARTPEIKRTIWFSAVLSISVAVGRLAIPVLRGAYTCLTGAAPGCGRYDSMYGDAASDRMARVCRCGGYFQRRHDGMRDAQVGVLQHYGVETRDGR